METTTDRKPLATYRVEDGVAVFEMDDPPANTYTHEMMRDLDECILRARFDDNVHVILIRGAGDKFFSAGANIAEGVAKGTAREFRRFLDISIGSLGELSYILLAARDSGLLSQSEFGELEALRDHANRLTWGLYRPVRERARRK